MRSREDVVRWLYFEPPTEEQTRAWIDGILARPPETGTVLAVELRASGELIGNVNVSVDPDNRQGEIGFIFHPDHQGHGYATEAGRRLVLLTRVADRPGNLARLLGCLADTGANIVDVSHMREGLDLHVRETAVEMVLETRGHDHAQRVLGTLNNEGYVAQVLH